MVLSTGAGFLPDRVKYYGGKLWVFMLNLHRVFDKLVSRCNFVSEENYVFVQPLCGKYLPSLLAVVMYVILKGGLGYGEACLIMIFRFDS